MNLKQFLASLLTKASYSGSRDELDQLLTTAALMHSATTEPLSPHAVVVAQHFAVLGNPSPTAAEIFTELVRLYTQARDVARRVGDSKMEANILFNLGRLYQDPPRKSLISSAGRGDEELANEMVARLYVSASPAGLPANQQAALSYYREAIGLARACGSLTVEACCLLNIAVAYRILGDATRFQQFLREAAETVETVPEGETKNALLAGIRTESLRLSGEC